MEEVIKLDFSKYWPSCRNTELRIKDILWLRRYGVKVSALPQDVQDKIAAAQKAAGVN